MTSSRNKLLLLIITVLVISNLALAAFLVFGKKCGPKHMRQGREAFSNFIKKELNFSEEQSGKFQQLTTEHFEKMRPIMQDIRQAKDSFFSLMRQPDVPSDSVLLAGADQIAQKQKFQELQSFRHFRQVRELCNDEQKPKFDTLIKKMINRSFSRGPEKGKKEPEKQKQ
jgi:protein CpxP